MALGQIMRTGLLCLPRDLAFKRLTSQSRNLSSVQTGTKTFRMKCWEDGKYQHLLPTSSMQMVVALSAQGRGVKSVTYTKFGHGRRSEWNQRSITKLCALLGLAVFCGSTNDDEDNKSGKREKYLDWEDYFMAVAMLSAKRSKDPRTQVGACIVNEEKRIVGTGYNGMPNGCHDDKMSWKRNPGHMDNKHLYVCHAELNAVLNKNSANVKNCTIYVALFPCNECTKVIIQSGIREVVYYSDKYNDRVEFRASKRMMHLAGIKYRKFVPKENPITIDFDDIERQSS